MMVMVVVMVMSVLPGIGPGIGARDDTTRVHFWLERGVMMMVSIVTGTTMPATNVSWRGHFATGDFG